ncbi:anti-repressor SinI family protein [Neobacillus novalis]|uniref:Anti-repressor SinI family protein n=1 Tax=Neobacillus novalis TaxID=220687 RepID=A0AA95MPZ3_9BACI|nr:anti-repressor SinI family protein [Neobacillus novalis]WHY87455.1 anti-repressor SinI family protein [Neobacillus novalis]
MVITEKEVDVIDQEWMTLILEAKELGLSIEEVRDFFNQQGGLKLITNNN